MKCRWIITAFFLSSIISLFGQNPGSVQGKPDSQNKLKLEQNFRKALVKNVYQRHQNIIAVGPEKAGLIEDSIRTVLRSEIELLNTPGKVEDSQCHGSLSGTIYESDGVTPLNNMWVQISLFHIVQNRALRLGSSGVESATDNR